VNLLEHMLRFDRNDRISLKDALAHPFITNTPRDDTHVRMRAEMDEAMKGVNLQGGVPYTS
jgi:serine/threonine protein kinase